jgi:glycosyltransferase involved in cell wall biosynthesis
MNVVITIPAFNEEKTIGEVIKEIVAEMNRTKYKYSILVVDDGSSDNTTEVARKAGAEVITHQINRGLAKTFMTEMKSCLSRNPDIIVHSDADGQYLAKDIPKLIKEVENGYDLVLGSRFKGKIEEMPFLKRLGNRAFSHVISSITKMKISDGQTGFRAFTPEVAKLKITSDYTYTQEQIIRAAKNNFKIKEVPVYFAKRGNKTNSRLMKNPLHYAIRAWTNLLRVYRDYEPMKFFGFIGVMSIFLGFILGLWILYTFINTNTVGGIPRVILSVLFIIIGIQILMFGFLADMLKK